MAMGFFLPLGQLAEYLKLQALPPTYFPWLGAILVDYCLLTTSMKTFRTRRYDWQ